MDLKVVRIEKPAEMNFILGQSHFIKTVEDIHEAIVGTNPGMKFGLAFCEASQKARPNFIPGTAEIRASWISSTDLMKCV